MAPPRIRIRRGEGVVLLRRQENQYGKCKSHPRRRGIFSGAGREQATQGKKKIKPRTKSRSPKSRSSCRAEIRRRGSLSSESSYTGAAARHTALRWALALINPHPGRQHCSTAQVVNGSRGGGWGGRRRRSGLFPHDGTELPTFFLCAVAPAFASGNVMPRPWRKGSRAGEARGCADCRAAPIRRQGRQGDGWGGDERSGRRRSRSGVPLGGVIFTRTVQQLQQWVGGTVGVLNEPRGDARH